MSGSVLCCCSGQNFHLGYSMWGHRINRTAAGSGSRSKYQERGAGRVPSERRAAMGNVRVIAATAQASAEAYRDDVEEVFREYRIPPGRLLRVRDTGNRMLGDVAYAVHREELARTALGNVTKISNIRDRCRRARIDPRNFDPPLDAA